MSSNVFFSKKNQSHKHNQKDATERYTERGRREDHGPSNIDLAFQEDFPMSPEKEVIKNALHGKNVGSKHKKRWDAEITPKSALTKYTKLKLSRNLWRAWKEFSQSSDIWANASEEIAAAQPFRHVCSFELC